MKEKKEQWRDLVSFLRETALKKGIPNKRISELTGLSEPAISRLFKMKHRPSLEIFLDVANSIGIKTTL